MKAPTEQAYRGILLRAAPKWWRWRNRWTWSIHAASGRAVQDWARRPIRGRAEDRAEDRAEALAKARKAADAVLFDRLAARVLDDGLTDAFVLQVAADVRRKKCPKRP